MVSEDSVHADLTIRCSGHTTDDDQSEATPANQSLCGRILNGSDHSRFVQSPRGEDRHGTRLQDRFTESALKFVCPDCGAVAYTCPVCSGDDNSPPGWFVGDSTGEQLPCHNCNIDEVRRQRRDPHSNFQADD